MKQGVGMKPDGRFNIQVDVKEVWVYFLLFTSTLMLFFLSHLFYFNGGESYEFCHYAEIAHQILSGHGFSTSIHYPSDLATLEKTFYGGTLLTPVVFRFPLFSYWSALWMKIARPDDFGMALGNGMAHALWVCVLYAMGKKLFNRRAAIFACALFVIHPMMVVGYNLGGYPDVLFGALFGLFNFVWWQALTNEGNSFRKIYFTAGLLAGLCFLARQTFLLWMPLYILSPFLFHRREKFSTLFLFAAGFLACSSIWFVYYFRSFHTVSTPQLMLGLADGTIVSRLPWLEYRTYAFGEFLSRPVMIRLLAKGYSYFNEFFSNWPKMWMQPLFPPLCVACLIFTKGTPRRFGLWLGVLLAWQVLIFSFLRYEVLGFLDGRYYLWAAPFFLLYGVAFLEKKLSSTKWKFIFLAILLLQLQSWALVYLRVIRKSDHKSGLPVSQWPEIAYLQEALPEGSRVASNIPTQIGWYTGHPAVNIPRVPEQIVLLDKKWPVEYLYLSTHRIGEPENYQEWFQRLPPQSLNSQETLKQLGFQLKQDFGEGWLFQKIKKG